MKHFILLLIFILLVNYVFTQDYFVFDKAHILSKNDTIECYVKIQGTYHSKFEYKLHKESEILKASIDTVDYIITNYNSYKNIRIKNKYVMPRIVCWGKINYYARIHYGPENFIKGDHRNGISRIRDWTTYYIEKQDSLITMPKRKVGENIAHLFRDNKTSFKKVIKMNKLNNDKIIGIIEDYNNQMY
ncbi:hypothetical protein [Marinifilum fragile]|uniref:hypothetical protein n=1 Tax=Marinifilum fragile TaxID=570161 RepID=UPI002AAA8370|nr:hypothetical protein [Marinifilum fragile]